MKIRIILLIIALVGCFSFVSQAQKGISEPTKTDSLATKAASEAMDLLSKEQTQRYQDSLENITLQLQIENTNELKVRHELEAQLNKKNIEDSIRHEKLKIQIEASKKGAIGYPVIIGEDTVRFVFTSFGTLSPKERARISTEKIKEISKLYLPAYDSLSIANEGMGIEILFRDNILTTVTQSDAIWEGKDQLVIANEIIAKTTASIVEYKKMTSVMARIKQLGFSLLIVIVAFFAIRFVFRSFRYKLTRFLLSKKGTWFKGWTIGSYEFLNTHNQVKFCLIIIKFLRLIFSLIIFFVAITMLFSIYPVTERIADQLWEWIFSPIKKIFLAIIDYLPKLFMVIVITLTMKYVIKGTKYIMDEIGAGKIKIKGFYPDWSRSTFSIIRIFLYALGLIMIFPYLPGSGSDVFSGVSIFLGALLSFGSSAVIGNLIAGIVITYMRPFKVGDHIKVGEITGDVMEKTAFVTRIKTYRQEIVTIPNGTILASSVINYSTTAQENSGVIFHTTVTMGYETPWRDVHKFLIEAALRSELVVRKPLPFVLQTSLDDFYVSYQLCVYSKHPERQAAVYSQLHLNIQDVFNENGLELLSPHYRSFRDGDDITIPKEYQPQGEKPAGSTTNPFAKKP